MKKNMEIQGTEKRKFTDWLITVYFITFFLMGIGDAVGDLLFDWVGLQSAEMMLLILYASFLGIWIVFLLDLILFRGNRPILKAIGTTAKGNTFGNLLLGLGIGFGMNAVCIAAAWLNGDIRLYFAGFRPGMLLVFFVAVFVQSSAEELVCRGFLYQRLRRGYRHPAVAILGNSLFFGMLHLGNDGMTMLGIFNNVCMGFVCSCMVYYFDSIWCPMAVHAAWNYTQNIIFGLPNSGFVSKFSIFALDAASAKDSFAYNVGFGVEATAVALVVLTVVIAGIIFCGRKQGAQETDIWRALEREAAA